MWGVGRACVWRRVAGEEVWMGHASTRLLVCLEVVVLFSECVARRPGLADQTPPLDPSESTQHVSVHHDCGFPSPSLRVFARRAHDSTLKSVL